MFVCSLNIGSLLKHFDEIRIFVDEYKPHILGLNETRLSDDVEDDDLFIEGYSIVRRDRNRNGGGVAIYISDDIPYSTRPDIDTGIESVSIQVNIPFIKPIIFTCVYRPPGSKVALFENIEARFSILDHEHFEFLVSGDFNCNQVNNTDNDTKHIKRIYGTYNCKQLITEYTRVTWNTQTIIDHVITNKPEHIATSGVIPCGISDHDVTYAVRSSKLPKRKKVLKRVTVRKYNKFDVKAFWMI